MEFRDFIGPTYATRSLNINASRAVNLYPQLESPDSKNVKTLIGTPGLSIFTSSLIPNLAIRGMWSFNSLLYVVQGSTLYSINSSGVPTSLATLDSSAGRVSMADNGLTPTGGNQLAIADGLKLYIYNVSSTAWSKNVTSNAHDLVMFLDGYFICPIQNSGQWQMSNLYDGLTWNVLNKSTADAEPDNLISVAKSKRQLWLLGEYSTEVWYDAGVGYPPFQRIDGVLIESGIHAKWSVSTWEGIILYLAQDKTGKGFAVRTVGYDPQRISTPSIEYQWSQYSTLSDAFGYCYSEESHIFWVLTFPTANATWVYDLTTKMWHERSSYVGSPYVIGRHIGNSYAFFNGNHMIGDYRNGNIYTMSNNVYSENGTPIVYMRTSPHIYRDQKMLFFHRLQIDMETGVGLDGGVQGSDPQALLSWSNDGGHTWSSSYPVSIGPIGQGKTRAIWRRLGKSRDRVFRLLISDPVKIAIIGANLRIEEGED